MSQFEFNLATRKDDPSLRELLAATPMQGDIQLAFAREPSFFGASTLEGQFVQIATLREKRSGRIIGMGSRTVSSCYVNGRVEDVGYLSALRLLQEYRGKAGLLARGYRFFRELHDDHRAPFYLTTIASDNHPAIDLLTSGRAGLPVYHPLGRYHTLTISSGKRLRRSSPKRIAIRRARPEEGEGIAAFLQQEGPHRQFFPAYSKREFCERPQRLAGLQSQSVLLAHVDGRLVGTMGVWDQRSFRQTIVHGYSARLRFARPLYNSLAILRAMPRLPRVGEPLNLRYAAIPVVVGNAPEIIEALLGSAILSLRQQGGDFLALGLHENDPLLPIIRPYSGREYTTLIYLVYWPDKRPDIDRLTDLVPYLELGCL